MIVVTILDIFMLIGVLTTGTRSQSEQLDFERTASALNNIKEELVDKLWNITFMNPDDNPQIKGWKAKCEQKHGAEVIRNVEEAPRVFMDCVLDYVDPGQTQIEFNSSMASGNLDRLFQKHCSYHGNILSCVDVMLDKFRVCMTPQQLKDVNVTRRAIDAAIHFMCHEDGERIALFLAGQGAQCLEESDTDIQSCIQLRVPELNRTLENPESLDLDSLIISREKCGKLLWIYQCLVQVTTKCSDATPSNILDSLIKQMLNVTPCAATNTMQAAEQTTSGATASGCNVGSLVSQTLAFVGPMLAGGVGAMLRVVGGVRDLLCAFVLGLEAAVAYTASLILSVLTACCTFVLYVVSNIWNLGTGLLNASSHFYHQSHLWV